MDISDKRVKLEYTIDGYSSYASTYSPVNIAFNCPSDQTSRWFTDRNTPDQYVLLKLKSPSIVHTITFGKYIKSHVSNLKKFTISGGLEESVMSNLLTAGLKNNNISETFNLRHKTSEGLDLPILYLKIAPQQSWGPAYNYSIWFVELYGVKDECYLEGALYTYNLRKEEEAVRIVLKHLRRRCYKDALEALSRESGVTLESGVPAKLWNSLVEKGDYDETEKIFVSAYNEGELEWYLSWQPYTPKWKCISQCSAKVEEALSLAKGSDLPTMPTIHGPFDVTSADRDWPGQNGSADEESSTSAAGELPSNFNSKPGPRGGHQLVAHPTEGMLYLFGGWDGTEDLDDLWRYELANDRWVQLCGHAATVGGPTPRSCHKMVLDSTRKKLYTLGRYLDGNNRKPENMKSDLYVYDIQTNEWSCVCEDCASEGGPGLVFDHQMCLDGDTATIYVFGGRLLPASTEEASSGPVYSGLYAYYINTKSWELILGDQHNLHAPQPRVGHSMLFHPVQRCLFIFGGQRNKEHLLDMWRYSVDSRSWFAVSPHTTSSQLAAAGFTQRATLDAERDHILVLSGLSKEKERRVCNSLWIYSLRRGTWTCASSSSVKDLRDVSPTPRFAHQLVYDPIRKLHYLFGGNPGITARPRIRLDDLWTLELERLPKEAVVAKARALLREAKYRSMANRAANKMDLEPAIAAVNYLREELHPAIDHNDKEQSERFRRLPLTLFSGESVAASTGIKMTPALCRTLANRRQKAARRPIASCSLPAPPGVYCAPVSQIHNLEGFEAETGPMGQVLPRPWDDGILPEQLPSDLYETEEEDTPAESEEDVERARRIELFDELSKYFRPSSVHPTSDVTHLICL